MCKIYVHYKMKYIGTLILKLLIKILYEIKHMIAI
jgi:hypothetical protein